MYLIAGFLPDQLEPYATYIYSGAAALAGLLVLALVWQLLARRKKADTADPVDDVRLADLPPAPQQERPLLLFEGQPARLRLVVLASPGRHADVTPEMAEGVLQGMFYGLGTVFRADAPRVLVWPPQLSQTGFAPIFFRHVLRPGKLGPLSRWVLVAGPARAGTKSVLLGLALEVNEPTPRGNVRMKVEQWSDRLRVLTVG